MGIQTMVSHMIITSFDAISSTLSNIQSLNRKIDSQWQVEEVIGVTLLVGIVALGVVKISPIISNYFGFAPAAPVPVVPVALPSFAMDRGS